MQAEPSVRGADERWARSAALLRRALQTIPIASQTFSKSHLQLPQDHAPLFAECGQGAEFTDVDGNRYIDLLMGLGAVTLGYADADVNAAIRDQLDRGISFSLPATLEMELAETIVRLVPSVDMVRYGKNGSDATSAAVRLARAFTGRDRIVAAGYHGWHDWYIGSTARHLGVPQAVRDLTHATAFNDLEAVETLFARHGDQIAGVILEPASGAEPAPGYLEGLRAITERHGALLIFDEIVTGFRFGIAGAQAHYGVTPDLSCFGKGMANGMPISVVAGRGDVMALMEEIFFSGTFGGESLSLAAALATLARLERDRVPDEFWRRGAALRKRLAAIIEDRKVGDVVSLSGSACLNFITTAAGRGASAQEVRTFMLAELIAQGVFTLGGIVLCQAFEDRHEEAVVTAFDRFAEKLGHGLETGRLAEMMDYPPIEPVFQVRSN